MRKSLNDSFFARNAGRLTDYFFDSLKTGLIGTLLSKYESEKQLAENSIFFKNVSSVVSLIRMKKVKYAFQTSVERLREFTGFDRFLKALLSTTLRGYSVSLMSFVFVTALTFYFRLGSQDVRLFANEILFLLTMLVLSLIMVFSGQDLSEAILQGRASNFVLFSILGLKRSNFTHDRSGKKDRIIICMAVGVAAGIVGAIISVRSLFVILAALITAYMILVSPESGLIILMLIIPFAGETMIVRLLFSVSLSYMFKLFRGKRSLNFELFDIVVLIFALLMLFAGLFSVDRSASFPRAVTMISVEIGYILIINLIKNKAWIHRSLSALICSSSIAGLYAVGQIVLKYTDIQSVIEFNVEIPQITSFFDSPLELAQYSALSLLLFFAALTVNRKTIRRIFFIFMCAACIMILYVTYIRSVWISITLAVVFFFLICSRKTLITLLCSIPVIPILPYILPVRITALFSEIFSTNTQITSYRQNLRSSIFMMIKDHFFGGCGIGGFALIYPRYAVEGVESPANSGSLYFEVIINMGIFGLLVLLMIVFLFMQSNFSYYTHFTKIPNAIPACGVAAMIFELAMGFAEYPWQDMHIFLLFWMTLGLSTAARRYSTESMRVIAPEHYTEVHEPEADREANQ